MKRLFFFLLISLCLPACLAKYTYNQTGPEYESRRPFSTVLVFLDKSPNFPVDPIGVLAFTDPLPRKIQMEEAKRHARKKGGNVLIRVKNEGTENQGGYTFRIARAEDIHLARTAAGGGMANAGTSNIPLGAGFFGAEGGSGASYGDFSIQNSSGGAGEKDPPLFKYYPEN